MSNKKEKMLIFHNFYSKFISQKLKKEKILTFLYSTFFVDSNFLSIIEAVQINMI